MVFILRNYNRFLIRTGQSVRWDNFYIHRFNTDFEKLIKFETKQEGEEFVKNHPEIETDFDAWVVETDPLGWR